MPVKPLISGLVSARTSLRALDGDERGAAAVEFAFLLPLLTLMLLGTIELGRAINMDGTRAALTEPAPKSRPTQAEIVPQHVKQRCIGIIDIHRHRVAIHL